VQFKGKWWLYFGQADSSLGVATADVQPWEVNEAGESQSGST
jgi:hypothetical protein